MNTEDVLGKHSNVIQVAEEKDYETMANERPSRLVECIADLAAALRAERERVAELEPDAKLGRMVREMPLSAKLGHEGQQWGEWYATWTSSRRYGPTALAALEAARKEET